MKKLLFILIPVTCAITAYASTPVTWVEIYSPSVCRGATLTATFHEVAGNEIASWYWKINGAPIPAELDNDPNDMLLTPEAVGEFTIEVQTVTGNTVYSNAITISRPDVTTSIAGPHIFCEGGSALISLNNYNSNFSYEWDQRRVDLCGLQRAANCYRHRQLHGNGHRSQHRIFTKLTPHYTPMLL